MLYKEISRVLAPYFFCLSAAVALFVILAGYYQFVSDPATHPQPDSFWAFLITLAVCLILATFFRLWGRKARGTLFRREGLALVVVIWFFTAFVAALPFSLSNTFSNPVDSYFEAMSGLTTTGATCMQAKQYNAQGQEVPIVKKFVGMPDATYTFYGTIKPVRNTKGEVVISGIEAVSPALLLWRSFTQWIGGMGIVVLFLAILPALGVGGKVLYQAEVPGPIKDAMTPRIRDTASKLWKLYLALSIFEVILLMATNSEMPLFDAVAITFSSISTGGYTVRNNSLGSYHSFPTEMVVMVFMFLGSVNFVLYAYLLQRKFSRWKDVELSGFILAIVVATLLIVGLLIGTQEVLLPAALSVSQTFSFPDALRYGSFNLLSVMTSTGMVTADFNLWPYACQVILLTVMYVGGMSGSTAGGVKVMRHIVLLRSCIQKVETIFRPQTVRKMWIGKRVIDNDRAMTVLIFFFLVIALTLLGTFLLVIDGVDPETALSVNGCMLNNIGVAFRMAGPTESFAFLTSFGKLLSVLWMVLGRLEYFAILIIFIPAFWRRA